jgi:hypothetical protein
MSRPVGLVKTGGRKKGTPNKRTLRFEEELNRLNINLLDSIVTDLSNLDSEKRVDVLLKLLPYLYSKPRFVESETEEEGDSTHDLLISLIQERTEAKAI